MGRVLDIFERHQMQLWSLIATHTEFRTQLQQESFAISDQRAADAMSHLLGEFEARLWEMVPIQLKCRTELLEMTATSTYQYGEFVIKEEVAEFIDDDGNDEMHGLNFLMDAAHAEPNFDDNDQSLLIYENVKEKPNGRRKAKALAPAAAKVEKPKRPKLRRYACDVCHAAFARHSNFVVHQRYHTDEKPFQCTVCNKAFHRSDTLKRHMTVHTGEQPYECPYCSRPFSIAGNMTKHIRRKHAAEAAQKQK